MDDKQLKQFDPYIYNQIQIGRTAIPALILINTAPFLATLNKITEIAQTPSLQHLTVAASWWGFGACFGILIWLFAYLNAACLVENRRQPVRKTFYYGGAAFVYLGVLAAIGSITAFVLGIENFAKISSMGLS